MRARPPPAPRDRRKTRPHRTAQLTVAELVDSLRSFWKQSTSETRAVVVLGVLAALSVVAASLNVLVHISFALAFAVVPLLLAPILLTVFAGVSAFVVLVFATAGAGVFFVGTPLFMLGLVAKALLPVVLTVGASAALLSRAARAGGRAFRWVRDGVLFEEQDDQWSDDERDDDDDHQRDEQQDELAEFDRVLRKRSREASQRSDAMIDKWSVGDVGDELDLCGLGQYRQLFIDERIDGITLLSLSDDDIRTEFIAMPLGDRRRLSRLVNSLNRRHSRAL